MTNLYYNCIFFVFEIVFYYFNLYKHDRFYSVKYKYYHVCTRKFRFNLIFLLWIYVVLFRSLQFPGTRTGTREFFEIRSRMKDKYLCPPKKKKNNNYHVFE